MIQLEDSEFKRKLVFINSIRIAVLCVILIVAVISLAFQVNFPIIPIIIFIFVSIVISFSHFSISKKKGIKFSVYIQIFSDIIIITGFVYFSGGVSSPLYFLYFLPILISAMFLSRRDTIYTAAFSYIIFGIISDLMYVKVLTPFPGPFDFELTNNDFIYNLIVSFIAFTFFALISSYFFENLRKKGNELRSVRENLKDLLVLNNMVLERMEDGLIVADSRGTIISYNEKAKVIFGLTDSSNIFKIIKFESLPLLRKKISDSGNRHVIELIEKGRILEITISIISDIYSFDEVFVHLVSDLTKRRSIEDELKKKEHFALIGEMSAGLAHEIRNPLASISGSIQYLQKDMVLKKETKNLMNIVVKESARLSDSIEEFLQFSKTSPPVKGEFELGSLVDEIIEIVAVNDKEILFKKRYGKGNIVNADRNKINQVVWNIINNSIKSSGGTGIIEINIYKKGGTIVLSITDRGTGMKRDELSKIFIPFFSKFTSGIGLGMAIVKRILDEHGFRIRINSEIKKGTEVTIWFNKD